MELFLYTCQSLPEELCDEIIYSFLNEKRYEGICGGNKLQINIKYTYDFLIPPQPDENSIWYRINKVLSNELEKHLYLYIKTIENNPIFSSENNFGIQYKLFDKNYFTENTFMIQKYIKKIGGFKYHNDYLITNNTHRVITYLWYLNDIHEGGETELWYGRHSIKPKKGKLFLFPAHWGYPHSGLIPISDDKYIITGWLYIPIHCHDLFYRNRTNILSKNT